MATLSSPSQTATASDNRFARFTTSNHSAPIWIASFLSLIFAICVLAVRLGFIKWRTHDLDDVLLTLAHVVGVGMWGSLFSSLNNGLGQAIEVLGIAKISQMQKSFFASRILLYISLALSKYSALIFIQRIFVQMPRVNLVANITAGGLAMWGLGSALAVSIGCPPSRVIPYHQNDHCVEHVPWLVAIAATDVFTEVVIIILPVIGLRGLQMPLKRRLLVIVAFSSRIPNIVTAIVYLLTFLEYIDHERPAIGIVSAVVWQNALLSYNLMSATIPALKGFVKGFTTGGLGYTNDMSQSGGSSKNNFKLRSLNKSSKEMQLLPDHYAETEAEVTSGQQNPKHSLSRVNDTWRNRLNGNHNESESIASHDSRRIMIKRDWEISRG